MTSVQHLAITMMLLAQAYVVVSFTNVVQPSMQTSRLPFLHHVPSFQQKKRNAGMLYMSTQSQDQVQEKKGEQGPNGSAEKHVEDDGSRENDPHMSSAKLVAKFQDEISDDDHETTLSIIVQGATGDLASRFTFPALFDMHYNGFIPENTIIVGYSREDLSTDDLLEKIRPFLEETADEMDNGDELLDKFLDCVRYYQGESDKESFESLVKQLEEWEEEEGSGDDVWHNRLYYFAIPPSVFLDSTASIKKVGVSKSGWTRLVLEKPFGRDLDSAQEMADELSDQFSEEYYYRIDHFLGLEMMQNVMAIRYSNQFFEPIWNRDHIESITFNFKETIGVDGRGSFFDDYGIIRDMMQNHMVQMFTMIAMEPPVTLDEGEMGESLRDEKLKVLRAVPAIDIRDVVIGQYTGSSDGSEKGYTELDDVDSDSQTATYAELKLYCNNRRWEGVPFIFRAGKALDEDRIDIVIKFKAVPGAKQMFGEKAAKNELIIELEPEHTVKMRMNIKDPGLKSDPLQTELNLSYNEEFPTAHQPEPYVRLLLEVLRGKQGAFVRRDELLEAWRVFTPMLQKIDEAGKNGGKVDGIELPLHKYEFGKLADFIGTDKNKDAANM